MPHLAVTLPQPGPRKRIVLALGLALGLGSSSLLPTMAAAPDRPDTRPADTLIRAAAEAGIQTPSDLPKWLSRITSRPVSEPASIAATRVVTNCNDSGSGSLRATISAASSGDVIDISGLACSVTLTSSIVTSVEDLTIRGTPGNKYAISGNNTIRPLRHDGTGELTLDGVTIRNGKFSTAIAGEAAEGGCIRSQGKVTLMNQAQVKYCVAEQTATSGSTVARGGAIFAAAGVSVTDGGRIANSRATSSRGNAQGGGIASPGPIILSGAELSGNRASTTSGIASQGGGLWSQDTLSSKYTNIENNTVVGGIAAGGGAFVGNASTVKYSSIIDNAANTGAALVAGTSSGSAQSLMHSTTIANNDARNSGKYGGALFFGSNATIRNSTISGNTEKNDGNTKYGAGIRVKQGTTFTLSSSIVSNNRLIHSGGNTPASDIVGNNDTTNAVIAGSHNLVGWSIDVDLPTDTLISSSPGLGPLADNGGLTKTMALLPGSPAINAGITNGYATDQRGTGYPRVLGGQADIGAFELWARIFQDGFESPL